MKSKLFLITVITCILILNFGFTSAYVNYYNGDMGLGIPLFEIKEKNIGYPVSLSYQAGIRVDQRSSPVGLGWSVNFPAVSRMVQGLPDGYNGAKVTYFSDPDDDADNTWEEVKYSVGKFLKRLPPGLTISFDPREVIVKNVIAGINAINYQLTKGSRSASFVDYSTLFLKKGNNMRFVDGYFYTLTKDNQDKAHSYARNYLLNEDLFCKGSESDEYKETSQGRLMCDKTVFIPCEVKFSGTGIEAYNSAFERANRYCADKLGMNPLDISDKHAICKSSKQFGFSNETTLSNYVCGINVIKDDGQIKDSYAVHKYAFESVINHSASWNIDREQPDSYIIQMPGLSGVLVPKQSQSVSAFDYRNTISWNLQTASSNMDKIVSIPNSFGIDRFGNSGNNNDITSFEAYDTYGNKYVFSEQEQILHSRNMIHTKRKSDTSCEEDYFVKAALGESFTTNWKLKTIISSDGKEKINFNYKKFNPVVINSPEDNVRTIMTECTINSYGYKTWSSAVSELSVLESIESTTQKAVFNYDLSKLDGAENMLPVLKSIQLFSKQGGKEYLTGKYDFVYDYSLASGALENDISSTSKKGRLTLKKLLSYGTGSEYLTYEFEYGYNPSWVESNHDRWGYYFDNSDSSNKYNHKDLPTGLRPEAWSLSKIYWPEGKTTEFVYEPDRYQYVQDSYFDEASYSGGKIVAKDTHYGGGLRVKLVTECNGMDECINTRYMYNKRGLDFNEEDGIGKSSEGESSGVATSAPGPYQKKIADEDENLMASAYGGAEVNYRTVTEVPFTDEEGMTKPYGYVLYTFTTAYQQPDTGSERETNNNNKRGMLEKVEYYSSTNKLLGSEENQYEIKSLNHKSLNFLDSVTTKVVQTKSIMDGLTKLQNIEYTENGLPRKTNTTNTNGQTLITTNQYAYEIYPEMKTKHMLGQVYETRMYENKESDSNVLSISRNIWAQFKGNWYPSLTELWVDDKTQFVGESQKMKKSKPGPNRIVSKIISYDDYGNVLESVDAKGNPTYFFYGDNNNPCSNDEKYNSFGHSVLTCTKNVLGHEAKTYLNNLYLVETVVSPNGETTQTEYDSFNRAKKLAGPGSTLSKPDITYEYHFFESKKNPNWVKTITKIDEKQSAVSITFTDGLGRTIQSQTQQSGNNWLVSKIDYYPETSLVSKTWKTKLASTKGQFDSSPGGGVYSSSLFENNPLMRIKEILPAISDKSKGAR